MGKRRALPIIAKAAVDVERKTGFPAEVLFAQCALESGWLNHAPGNNPFGIKYKPERHADRQLLRTKEWFTPEELAAWLAAMPGRAVVEETDRVDKKGRRLYVVMDWFAKFGSLSDACSDYIGFLTRGRYAKAWQVFQESRDWRQFVHGIAKAGYATAPNYAESVIAMLDKECLAAIEAERGSTKTGGTLHASD